MNKKIFALLLLASGLLVGSSATAPPKEPSVPSPSVLDLYLPLMVVEWKGSTPEQQPDDTLKMRRGTPVDITRDGETLWVVNPDSGSITALSTQDLSKSAEIAVGEAPWSLAVSDDGRRVFVVARGSGELVVVNAESFEVVQSVTVGAEPGYVILSPTGASAYVTLPHQDQLIVLNTVTLMLEARIPVAPHPLGIAMSNDGDGEDADEQIYLTHLFAQSTAPVEATDEGRIGLVSRIDASTGAVEAEISLPSNEQGFPNLLASIALGPRTAWISQVRAAPDLPNGLTTTLFASVSVLDLGADQPDAALELPLNDQLIFGSPVNNPVAAVPSPDFQRLYVVAAGSNVVEVVDISTPREPKLVKFLAAGTNPRGMVLSPDGARGYVMNYLSRTVTVLDLESLKAVAEITVTDEALSREVLRGKILFNDATSPKLTTGSWISCASCHPDGGTDSLTWIFPDGPRQTPPLWNAYETLPWHWSAALDEFQDVEETVGLIQHGLGLAPGKDPALLDEPNRGRSADLDALAAFLERGIRVPQPPAPEGDLTNGRKLFTSAGCAECHGGATWTSSVLSGAPGTLDADGNGMVDEVLRNVGTLNPRDVRGASGFDPPSVLNVGLSAPYLHDGSIPDLELLLLSGHPNPGGAGNGLEEDEVADLVRFLQSIGPETEPVAVE